MKITHKINAFVLVLAVLAPACGGSDSGDKVDYAVTAKENFDKGETAIKDEDWLAAAKYFAFIKARFPYSKFAVLAELGLADAEYGAGHYIEAVDNYKTFIKFHPTHEKVTNGYAAFRICESYYQLLPGDFFILPPSEERDQASTDDADLELRSFLDRYPDSEYHKRATEMRTEINQRLAQHEMYVAQYYWDRDRPMGTVLRLRKLLEKYPGSSLDPDALYFLGEAYLKVKMRDRAKEIWQTLVTVYPKHKNARRAKKELARL